MKDLLRGVGWAGALVVLAAPAFLDGLEGLRERLEHRRLHTRAMDRRIRALEGELRSIGWQPDEITAFVELEQALRGSAW